MSGYDLEQASVDRDEALAKANPRVASTSQTLARCATCGHWNAPTVRRCADCQLSYVARPALGMPVVR